MKHYILILITAFFLLNVSCEKEIKVDSAPDFQVSLEQPVYKVGEEVQFNFSGFAEIISFYSGEVGNDYEFKDGRVVDVSSHRAMLSFRSAVKEGSQEDQLSVFISTDFDGDTSSIQSVKSANWVDITDSFDLAESEDFIASGDLDISQYTETNPVYIAFKYITKPQMINGDARLWLIENFKIKTRDTIYDDQLTILSQNEAGFYVIDEDKKNNPSRTSVTSTRLSILGNSYADPDDPIYDPENPIFDPDNPIYDPDSDVYDSNAKRPEYMPYDPEDPFNDPLRETWIVTKPIYTKEVDLGPDWSKAIRGIRDQKLEEYSYSYTKPGTYNAVFVGKNATIDQSESEVRKVTVTIEP